MSDLDVATDALREEGSLDPARKDALRQRLLAPKKKASTKMVRFLLPVAAVLAAASVWAASRSRTNVTVSAPVSVSVPVSVSAPVPVSVSVPVPLSVSPKTKPQHPVDDTEQRALRAYRGAERLQFTDADYAAALDAWDRYLALGSVSPLVVDARYARALCYVHLGRRDEARDALAPFARGELGTYRQSEARALLDKLQ